MPDCRACGTVGGIPLENLGNAAHCYCVSVHIFAESVHYFRSRNRPSSNMPVVQYIVKMRTNSRDLFALNNRDNMLPIVITKNKWQCTITLIDGNK